MAITGTDLIINRADLSDARLREVEFADTPPAGQVLLRIDQFALTANTITYGTATDSLGYWNFFPVPEEGFGRIPAWGFADVVASSNPDIAVGRRVYGYMPMSTHLMVKPGKVSPDGFSDKAAHRQKMAPIYNRYVFTNADPGYAPEAEAQIALFRPLFTTSFLLADFFQRNEMFGAQMLTMSSASSKTALGLAAEMTRVKPEGVEVVGFTSPGNVAFVEGLGLYDRVLSYDEVGALSHAPAAYVDFSGNGDFTLRLHSHFGDQMRHSAQVGVTDWQNANLRVPGLPGPKPQFFFAPLYAQERIGDWGMAGFQSRLAEAWAAFTDKVAWLDVTEHKGPEAAKARYLTALVGEFDPRRGDMVSLQNG
ncbi:DUF2855 family protein [Aestuariivita boseongensis]|uniref:DUF2855 family protein n=1 Tax=Aestuariivita boseongensis TaxID=1470562 RepID=UPI0006802666|nr:DUF2855 family protein [Aestuariivita boseongensis]